MKILLLSDVPLCADGGGIAQTLYNVFSFANPEDIFCIVYEKPALALSPSYPFDKCFYPYKFYLVPVNRITKRFKSLTEWLNYSFNYYFRSFKAARKKILEFNADVIVVCYNSPIGLSMHKKLLKGTKTKKVFPYFMDDWMSQSSNTWLGKKVYKWTNDILSDNKSWIMISQNLSQILEDRHGIKPDRLLEIHNPVDVSDAMVEESFRGKDEYTLVYAGALWPMHFDSFYAFAKAVNELNDSIKINLVLYTALSFWGWHQAKLKPLGVVYGGHLPYKEVHNMLARADALLVVSSFSKEWQTHSQGSLQTKITDYLKARKLIISCGPHYSANNQFLKKNECGICIETNEYLQIAEALDDIFKNFQSHQGKVAKGWELLQNEFTFSIVHSKFKEFISAN